MSGKQIASELQEEATCPICMDILKEPVTIDCGHNFCLGCISNVGKADDPLLCPLCKISVNRSTFRHNKLLANLAEKIRAIDPADLQPEDGELRCNKHKEKFHYFCEEDGEFLCLVCRDTKDHKSHNVSLIDDAVQNYQEQIQAQLQVLGQKDKEIVEMKKRGEGIISVFKAQAHLERLKIREEFKRLRKNLEKEERFLVGRLLWLEQEGDMLTERYGTETEKQLSSLRNLTRSLRAKEQITPRDLLQDIKVTLSRSQEFHFFNPTPVPVDLQDRISKAKSRHESTLKSMKKFIENLEADGKQDKDTFTESMKSEDMKNFMACLLPENNAESPASAPVTLNPESADPDLILSQDLRKMSLYFVGGGSGNKQSEPRPFDPFHCVLGSQGLSSGHQVWEAEFQGTEGRACVVGVATELAPGLHSQNHIWALRVSASECQPITESSAQQNLPIRLSKVGVYLDRDGEKVIFFDSATNEHIYTFQGSFTGNIFPFFGLLNPVSRIILSP